MKIKDVWKRLNYLVPEPQCRTRDGEIFEWKDTRPQPTEAALLAVDLAVADTAREDKEDDERVNSGVGIEKALMRLLFNYNNRIRILEGEVAINRGQFNAEIKSLIKGA